uniref:Uncharacterized protein n=1 Tax=Timema monikensis TaxID=170555 RepID=A0A7R9E688_9NEOP|nr:unnamed protein product [Timema monikensis]
MCQRRGEVLTEAVLTGIVESLCLVSPRAVCASPTFSMFCTVPRSFEQAKLIHTTEIRASISPSSAVELNTTSELANYATEGPLTGVLRHVVDFHKSQDSFNY